MPAELSFFSALLVGLFGSVHCIGMCGGIAGSLGAGAGGRDGGPAGPARLIPFLLAYNTGRIASYSLAGAVAGLLGAELAGLLPADTARAAGRFIAAAFLIALGLYLAGFTRSLAWLERAGSHLWRRVEPLGRRFLPARSPLHALGLGLVWGWLPCGLVYSALAWSLTAGSAGGGALLMLGFGLGTLPVLLALGAAGRWLFGLTRRLAVRRTAGVLIAGFGVYALLGGAHRAHQGSHDAPPARAESPADAHAAHRH